MKIKEILQATKGKLIQGNEEEEINEFCRDTRIIKEGASKIYKTRSMDVYIYTKWGGNWYGRKRKQRN